MYTILLKRYRSQGASIAQPVASDSVARGGAGAHLAHIFLLALWLFAVAHIVFNIFVRAY